MDMLRAINRRISTDKFDANMAQFLCYGIGLMIMVLGITKVASMRLSEAELLFGILLVMIVAMQAIIVGVVLGLYAKVTSRSGEVR